MHKLEGHDHILEIKDSGKGVYNKDGDDNWKDVFYIVSKICLGELISFVE